MVRLRDKPILGAVFCLGLHKKAVTARRVSEYLGLEERDLTKKVSQMTKSGMLSKRGGKLRLTDSGRKRLMVVFIGGGFEVIHRGHLYTIEKAKSLGDVLVVVVAKDSTIRRRKGREPVANELERVKLLSSLRQVDAAILGVEGDIYETLEKVRPDIVALGYDQYHLESDIIREGGARRMMLKVVRLDSPYPAVKTSALLKGL